MQNTVNWDLPVTRNALQRRKPHSMYNKLFTRILDSSIWLEPTPTRIVWLTMIAAMDEDGFAQFASVSNVAHRAVVSLEEAQEAIKCLEGPDPNSSNPDNEGRRIERVDGGWMVINAPVYRSMATRIVIKEQTRDRVRKFREAKGCNAHVTQGNELVTPSETDSDSDSKAEAIKTIPAGMDKVLSIYNAYPRKIARCPALASITKALKKCPYEELLKRVESYREKIRREGTKLEFIPYPASWFNADRWLDEEQEVHPSGKKLPFNAASEYAEEIKAQEGLL